MIYTYPDYYKKFSCIADKCPDTCCGKWQIVIDDDSLERYQEYDGDYRPELHRKVNWKEGVFRHGRSGKCAFLRDDMLCDMYIHMGKDSLCTTCREYPRHTEEFENVREISLSLSCPEVARILMNITDKVTFVTEEDDEDEVFDDFDYFLYSNLEDIREEILNVIQDRSVDIRSRIERVIQIGGNGVGVAMAHDGIGDVAVGLDGGALFHGGDEQYLQLQTAEQLHHGADAVAGHLAESLVQQHQTDAVLALLVDLQQGCDR